MSSLLLILLSAVLVCHYGPTALGGRVFGEVDTFRNACGIALASLLLMAVIAPFSYSMALAFGKLGVGYLQLFALVIVIMTLSQLLTVLMQRWGWTPLRPGFAMLVAANPAVLGIALFVVHTGGVVTALASGIGAGFAFAVLLLAFTTLHMRVMQANVPTIFREIPIALISVGLMALACMGLTGLIRD